MLSYLLKKAEAGKLSDSLIRVGIRLLLNRKLAEERKNRRNNPNLRHDGLMDLSTGPIAEHPDMANEQHYEVPPEFFIKVLGAHLKYSCSYYSEGLETLTVAEEAMLKLTCERAELLDGMQVLELGCGWGSLTLWMAEHYPKSKITAVSNSEPQRLFIESRAADRGLTNITIITQDMNNFEIHQKFHRVVSVEMFEHMRNYKLLLDRIAGWLESEGKLFVHIFCHKEYIYPFEVRGAGDWMAQYFFTGGIMPSEQILELFPDKLVVEKHWAVQGHHYGRTCQHWLMNLDRNRESIIDIFRQCYGHEEAEIWLQRWRIFFLACEELFNFHGGTEWFVSHNLMKAP